MGLRLIGLEDLVSLALQIKLQDYKFFKGG